MATIKTAWLITAKTNLHVGDECSTGYGIIDKSVQRNPITKLPCINSSSLKGAINEYICHNSKLEDAQIHRIFGSNKREKSAESTKGAAVFFDANLLAYPQQNDSDLYKLITSSEVITDFINKAKLLIPYQLKLPNYLLVSNSELREICSNEELPIIARNHLENGESMNLWYEQIVPQETVFYTFMDIPEEFVAELNGKIVQIGANATIGYGYCEFKKL